MNEIQFGSFIRWIPLNKNTNDIKDNNTNDIYLDFLNECIEETEHDNDKIHSTDLYISFKQLNIFSSNSSHCVISPSIALRFFICE